ncbi:hypothetical protein Tco_0877928 [Tanacetum coccineum]|uniref:Uncharacterized protein n=1 Tax=Tanacetum coccineum TaxID=301880 RepID=A0ABQ5BYY7_9ASTR
MVACKPTTKEGRQKKTTSEADKPKKPTPVKKPAPAKQTKLVKEKATQPPPTKKIRKKFARERMSLESFWAPVGGVAIREPTSGVTRSLLVVEGKGKAIDTDEQRRTLVTEEASTGPLVQPKDDTSANIVCDLHSPPRCCKTGVERIGEQLNMDESLDDAFTYGDQFLYDKPTEEELDKANVEIVLVESYGLSLYYSISLFNNSSCFHSRHRSHTAKNSISSQSRTNLYSYRVNWNN